MSHLGSNLFLRKVMIMLQYGSSICIFVSSSSATGNSNSSSGIIVSICCFANSNVRLRLSSCSLVRLCFSVSVDFSMGSFLSGTASPSGVASSSTLSGMASPSSLSGTVSPLFVWSSPDAFCAPWGIVLVGWSWISCFFEVLERCGAIDDLSFVSPSDVFSHLCLIPISHLKHLLGWSCSRLLRFGLGTGTCIFCCVRAMACIGGSSFSLLLRAASAFSRSFCISFSGACAACESGIPRQVSGNRTLLTKSISGKLSNSVSALVLVKSYSIRESVSTVFKRLPASWWKVKRKCCIAKMYLSNCDLRKSLLVVRYLSAIWSETRSNDWNSR